MAERGGEAGFWLLETIVCVALLVMGGVFDGSFNPGSVDTSNSANGNAIVDAIVHFLSGDVPAVLTRSGGGSAYHANVPVPAAETAQRRDGHEAASAGDQQARQQQPRSGRGDHRRYR